MLRLKKNSRKSSHSELFLKGYYIFMKNFYDKEPTLSEQGGLKIKENLKKGLATLLIICVCIACYFAFLRFDFIADVFEKISDILRPVIYGFVIAYLLNPVM